MFKEVKMTLWKWGNISKNYIQDKNCEEKYFNENAYRGKIDLVFYPIALHKICWLQFKKSDLLIARANELFSI